MTASNESVTEANDSSSVTMSFSMRPVYRERMEAVRRMIAADLRREHDPPSASVAFRMLIDWYLQTKNTSHS